MSSMSTRPITSQLPPTKLSRTTKKEKSPFRFVWERFMKNKMAVAGVWILLLLVLLSICAPLLTTYDPAQTDLYQTESQPDEMHFLGTDDLGRDVYARLLYGGRISLLIGLFTMIFTVSIGGTLGAMAGYFGKWVDHLVMRISDMLLTLPSLLIILTFVAILPKTDEWTLIYILAVTSWSGTARLLRGEFLSLREREYVLSAKAIGCGDFRIIFRHMVPNALAPLIVNATLLMAAMIIIESALSFLGFGVPPTTPTWGNMLNQARNLTLLEEQPWLWIPPLLLIVLTVLAINFIGDGLRDAFDTQATRR
jgi:peptide/nickel transport system permease protein